jgi:hypothetical protein
MSLLATGALIRQRGSATLSVVTCKNNRSITSANPREAAFSSPFRATSLLRQQLSAYDNHHMARGLHKYIFMFKVIIMFMAITMGLTLGLTVFCAKGRSVVPQYVKILAQHEYEPWNLKKK